MKRPPLFMTLPEGPGSEVLEALKDPRRPLSVAVPTVWCYRIQRAAPPGGWNLKLRTECLASLFPEDLEQLHWDQELGEDGAWMVWALPKARLERALGSWGALVWVPGRKVRIHPALDETTEAPFPNLAPQGHRARRIPWRRLRKLGLFSLPVALPLLFGGIALALLVPRWHRLKAQEVSLQQQVQGLQKSLDQERIATEALSALDPSHQKQSLWLNDLDALTRLLPEDTRLVGLKWRKEEIQIELITPKPESIREILEASPEFKGVRFQGNLDRKGEKSRLNLLLQPEEAR